MSVIFKGMIEVSGKPDSGKSRFAQECGASPGDMAYIIADLKESAFVAEMKDNNTPVAFSRDLVALTDGMKEIDTHNVCLRIISEMEDAVKNERNGKKFEALIWDTWTSFEITFHPYVRTFPNKFRAYWSPNGMFKGAEEWKSSFKYESEIINRLLGVSDLVILTTHLKPHAINGHKTGKFVPDVKQPIVEKAMMRAYLFPGEPKPTAIILKRISKTIVTENGIRTISVLPRKVVNFTWDKIKYYWDNPVGDRALTPGEMPNEFELSILDDVLTDEQKMILSLAPVAEDEEEVVYPAETIELVKKMREDGKPKPVMAKEANITVADVNRILVGLEGK